MFNHNKQNKNFKREHRKKILVTSELPWLIKLNKTPKAQMETKLINLTLLNLKPFASQKTLLRKNMQATDWK